MYNSTEHYSALLTLCKSADSPFYFVDQSLDGVNYRIFSYRLASYTDFRNAYARECRGHMFEIDENNAMVRVASMPMQKFFNLNENPFTTNMDFSHVNYVMDKLDGSLISTFFHKGAVRFKSKTSLHSSQAVDAFKLFNTEAYENFRKIVNSLAPLFTINMEYTAPDNRIVIPHQEPKLTILNARNNSTGEYMGYSALHKLAEHYGVLDNLVKNIVDQIADTNEFVSSIKGMSGIEGYVIFTPDEIVKVKTEWYSALHRAKDSVNSPKALFEVVVNEAHDDLRASFADDAYVCSQIDKMEEVVKNIYANIKLYVDKFHNENRHLDRKSYAILAQMKVPQLYFSLAMNEYLDKENDYKAWMLRNYKYFGISDAIEEKE